MLTIRWVEYVPLAYTFLFLFFNTHDENLL